MFVRVIFLRHVGGPVLMHQQSEDTVVLEEEEENGVDKAKAANGGGGGGVVKNGHRSNSFYGGGGGSSWRQRQRRRRATLGGGGGGGPKLPVGRVRIRRKQLLQLLPCLFLVLAQKTLFFCFRPPMVPSRAWAAVAEGGTHCSYIERERVRKSLS